MKSFRTSFIKTAAAGAFLLFAATTFAQGDHSQDQVSNRGRVRESSIPEEYKVPPVGSAAMLKQSREDVEEAQNERFRNLASFTNGTSDKVVAKAELPSADSKQYKLVVLFERNASWAAPLSQNKFAVADDMQKVLSKYNLSLAKYYGAENELDGLVLKFTNSSMTVVDAAKEISKVKGVKVVHLKSPR
jgi:hypothetical protein